MKRINKTNYKSYSAEELAQAGTNGTLDLIETGITGLVEIVKYIFGAIGQRKLLRKKVEAIEEVLKHQQELNQKFAEEIEELKARP